MPREVARRRGAPQPAWRRDAVILLRVLGALLAWAAGAALGGLGPLALRSLMTPQEQRGPFGTLAILPSFLLGLIALLVYVRVVDRRPVASLGLPARGARTQWFRGALVGGLMMGIITLVWLTVVGGASVRGNGDAGRAFAGVTVALLVFMVQGPSEELLFRGYVQGTIAARWGVWAGVAVSAAIFGVLHGLNPSFGVVPAVNLILFGVAAAVYKLVADGGSLWGVFAIHTVWNWLQEFVFGLENSGTATNPGNVLFQLIPDKSRPSWVWGGGFGPEGTLGATIVLAALVATLLLERRARSAKVARAAA